jgi:hypothetical protein
MDCFAPQHAMTAGSLPPAKQESPLINLCTNVIFYKKIPKIQAKCNLPSIYNMYGGIDEKCK